MKQSNITNMKKEYHKTKGGDNIIKHFNELKDLVGIRKDRDLFAFAITFTYKYFNKRIGDDKID